jgi:hypothetical protein
VSAGGPGKRTGAAAEDGVVEERGVAKSKKARGGACGDERAGASPRWHLPPLRGLAAAPGAAGTGDTALYYLYRHLDIRSAAV